MCSNAMPVASMAKNGDDKGRIARISRIGCYILGNKLGEGSFAIVREAKHAATDESVAIKLFDRKAIDTDYLRKALDREGHIMRRLSHPHIIEVLETEREEEEEAEEAAAAGALE